MKRRRPPFQITGAVLALCGQVERLIGRVEGADASIPEPHLRKQHRVRTIRGSVAIEGNTLSEDQVTAVLEGKRVVGSRRELLEVTNANAAYELAPKLQPGRERDLLAAHRVLMTGLVDPAGRYRTTNVGVLHGTRVRHIAPPADRVPALIHDLLAWVRTDSTPILVKSCVVHYELLFIHPFVDGNGRIARLWQLVTLLRASPVYAYVPVESVIRERQTSYYAVLNRCDHAGDSTEFVTFVLTALRDSLAATVAVLRPRRTDPTARLEEARRHLGRGWFTRAAYLAVHRSIATATASRDLAMGVANGLLERRGDRRLATYRYRRRTQ